MSARPLLVLACALTVACVQPREATEREIALELPEDWAAGSLAPEGERVDGPWWYAYGDSTLHALIDEALANNPDVQAAAARLLLAEAASRVQGANLLPNVDAVLGRNRRKQSFIGFPTGGPGGGGGGDDPVVNRATIYNLGLEVSWEADLWGRLAAEEAAAVAQTQAAWADQQFVALSLAASVVKAWYVVAEAELQLALAQRTAESWERTYELTATRYRGGLAPALDARLTAVDLERARAQVVTTRANRDDAVRVLELLVGRYPATSLQVPDDLPAPRAEVPAGLPVTLLARRADLYSAERRMLSAERLADARRADFYPDLVLTGSVGTQSTKMSDLLDGDFSVWSIVGQLVQPVFQGGRLEARLDQQEAVADESLALFTRTLLDALFEVESALAGERDFADEVAVRTEVAEEATRAGALARRRYVEGLIGVTTLLDAERNEYLAQQNLLQARLLHLLNRMDLHLALGGGFNAPEPTDEPIPEGGVLDDVDDVGDAPEAGEEGTP